MMAETAAWGAPSNRATQKDDDDTWHVAIAPDEVKIVSLEQLDDLFRLSLVDSETKVWQAGMDEWLPLGVVAGIDHGVEQELPTRPMGAVPRPPAPAARRAPPPPRPKSVAPAPVASLPPAPVTRRPAMPAPHIATAPWPPAPAPASRVVASAWPAAAAPLLSAPAQTLRPVVTPSFYPSYSPPAPVRTSGLGRFVIWVALLAGAGVTLYRNDVLRDAAHSIGQDARYAQLEARIGGPAFGTLRAVEANTSAAAQLATPDAQVAAPIATHEAAALAPAAHTADTSTPSAPVVSLESLRPEAAGTTPTVKSEPKKAVAAAAFVSEPVAKPQAKAVAAAPPPPKAEPKAAAAPKAAPPPKAEAPQKSEADMSPKERLNAAIERAIKNPPPSNKKSGNLSTGLKGTSNEYDPLNPKL